MKYWNSNKQLMRFIVLRTWQYSTRHSAPSSRCEKESQIDHLWWRPRYNYYWCGYWTTHLQIQSWSQQNQTRYKQYLNINVFTTFWLLTRLFNLFIYIRYMCITAINIICTYLRIHNIASSMLIIYRADATSVRINMLLQAISHTGSVM